MAQLKTKNQTKKSNMYINKTIKNGIAFNMEQPENKDKNRSVKNEFYLLLLKAVEEHCKSIYYLTESDIFNNSDDYTKLRDFTRDRAIYLLGKQKVTIDDNQSVEECNNEINQHAK